VIEALIFSLALADRLKSLQSTLTNQTMQHLRDRDMLITEQRRQLEVEVAERTEDLALQMSRSDELLHNVLPVEIAAELKLSGASLPRRFDNVSILFTDFVGFTTVVSSLPPQRLVEEINDMFKSFDDILAEVGVEKIKTIGDSYMIASGLPETVEDHAERCVVAAQRMFAYLEERNQSAPIKWNMRAGIHSGAVVAGIVGKHKFAYDVFGDTVNIASRMESAGSPGRINISAYTYDLIRHRFTTTYRGKINAKGKGEIDMYFVEAAVEQPAAS
jgi:class 3 adenylate cyclase